MIGCVFSSEVLDDRTHIKLLLFLYRFNSIIQGHNATLILMEYNSDLEIAFQDFKLLVKENTIPNKMLVKLQYLESAILDLKKESELIQQLPEYQRLSLLQMNRQTKISLFINIVKCFASKEIIEYFSHNKSTIRKQQTFSGWVTCFISCNSNCLTVAKNIDNKDILYEFQIENLWISKAFCLHKKRYIFGLAYKNQKYQLGFEQQSICQRIHSIVINLIRQRKTIRQKIKQVSTIQSSQIEAASELQFEKQDIFYGGFNQIEYIESEEKQYLCHLQEKVMKYQIFDNSNFELVKNIDKGRILQNKIDNSYKVILLLEKISIESSVQKFIELTKWNAQVQDLKILNRIRTNAFLVRLKFKKFNMISFPREAEVIISYIKSCSCLFGRQQSSGIEFGKHYLLMTSASHEFQSSGTVKMDLQQIAQFSVVDEKTILLTCWSKIDFKCYDYFNYNKQMNIQYLDNFSSFVNYCKENSHIAQSRNFDWDYCACKLKRRRKNSCQSDKSYKSKDEESFSFSKKRINVATVVQNCLKGIYDDAIIEIIKKRLFERYYLNHRFRQSENQQYKLSKFTLNQQKDFLLQKGRWKIFNNNLIYCDEQALRIQKGMLKIILKQIGSNLLAGKSIMNMSMPVQIFDNKSMLEVVANMMGFFPRFIHEAVNANNPIEQIKYVTMCFLFMSSCFPNVQKPFNPILGQTFQGTIGGIPIYLEQTFHHPPISTMYMKTADFQAYGNFDFHVELGLNSAYSKISYFSTVKIFKSKTQYLIKLPDAEMGGLSFGDRTLRLTGRGFVYEKTNDIYCQFSVGKDKKKVYEYSSKLKNCDLAGGIFKVSNSYGKKIIAKDGFKTSDGVKYDDIVEKYSHITGKWYGDISFDNVVYKSLENGPFPVKVERSNFLLPSDCLFRADIIYKNRNQTQKSNEQKQILQNLQRNDKKLRQKYKH